MAERCQICGAENGWRHDHRPDGSGIDDGPQIGRKKPAPKSAFELGEIRAKAWETRREKFGPRGHR